MHDADHLLIGVERFEHLFADGLLRHMRHEFAHDRKAHIGFEQRLFDQLEAVAHVGFGKFSFAAQGLKRATQSILQGFKHGGSLTAASPQGYGKNQ